jgi:hypothetical protein
MQANKQWKNILDKDVLKGSINMIALFITVYELLEDSIISKPKNFFTTLEFDEKAKQEHQKHVLSLYNESACPGIASKNKELISSLIWFKNNGAIDDEDIKIFADSRSLRNKVTHEMLYAIADGGEQIVEQFVLLYALFSKIEKWWIMEIEIPISGDFEPDTIDQDGVMSGHMIILEIILDILSNDSNSHFKEACEKFGVEVK